MPTSTDSPHAQSEETQWQYPPSIPSSPEFNFSDPGIAHDYGMDELPDRARSQFIPALNLKQIQQQQQQTSQSATNGYHPEQQEELPALQVGGVLEDGDRLEPTTEDDPTSYNLVAAPDSEAIPVEQFSLEKRSGTLFSRDHLSVIFSDPSFLLKFTSFLGRHRPKSVPLLVYYLDALKALRALHYANAICEGLDPLPGLDFTTVAVDSTVNKALETRADSAFEALAQEELPAFITHQYIQIVSSSIQSRITGRLAPHLREASEGLAEVFCLTDPSRADNPIVFASEEFNRTTQYGMQYILGKNCRFLQGPATNPLSVRRIRDAIAAGRQHQEVFLNYRRDGSPFMNLLMIAPLCDSRGQLRYFIGAQVDVSGLVKDCSVMESLERLVEMQERGEEVPQIQKPSPVKSDELQELSEMLNQGELATIRRHGGRMHREMDDDTESLYSIQPRLLLKEQDPLASSMATINGKLSGVYQHYLLVRPYPALRVLFASPSQRVPGILQSPFMNKIGGSNRVREEMTNALAEGRGVTARVRWISKTDEEGRNRWVHCTPLVGSNGAIGVWMVVIVDDEKDLVGGRYSGRQAPPMAPGSDYSRTPPRSRRRHTQTSTGPGPAVPWETDDSSLKKLDEARRNGAPESVRSTNGTHDYDRSEGNQTPSSLRIG